MKKQYSKELIEKIKKYYLDSNFSLEALSENSDNLFGVSVTLADLKYMSRSDMEGQWSIIRANSGRKTEDVPVREKLQNVADKLYNLIVDDASEVSANQIAQIAKTWSDLIDKAKLDKDGGVAKTSAQQVKDMIEKELLKR